MPLAAGTRLGPYEIVAPLGAGGMGEVYRARDTRLERTVAIKVLPEALAGDPQFRERFEREAKTISQLDHPNICAVYDVGEQDGTSFLVMQYLEGETLADRIGPRAEGSGRSGTEREGFRRAGLPIGEALAIAIQIADALDKAHRAGIVHRDLKPGNIFLVRGAASTPPVAKLLDFGLAKTGVPAVTASTGGSMLPTTPANVTAAGTILGTFQYMSPEQLESGDADARSDIFSFGAVLYEMIAGRKAFEGKSTVSLIGAILEREPAPLSTVAPTTPPALDRIVKRCLAKDPDARWQTASDLAHELRWVSESAGTPEHAQASAAAAPAQRRSSLLWKIATAALAVAAVAGFAAAYVARSTTPAVVRFFIDPPEKASFVSGGRPGASASISPDGRRLVFTVRDSAQKVSLWIRGIDALASQPLPGTDEASFPFWSPDSKWIAFFTRDKLMKIAADGGPPQTLCDAVNGRGGAWNRDGVILFGAGGLVGAPLNRIPSAGGQPVAVTKVDGVGDHRYPSFLPDGRHFVFYRNLPANAKEDGMYVGSLDDPSSRRIISADTGAVYSAGHLLFVRQATLLAQPFSLKTLQPSGDPIPVAEHVTKVFPGILAFSVSDDGTLAYGIGPSSTAGAAPVQLTWVDRQGKTIEAVGPPGRYYGIDLAPDGPRIVTHRHDGGSGDIWIIDGARIERFTLDASIEHESPIWSPDGEWIAYGVQQPGKAGLYRKRSNGAGTEEVLLETPGDPVAPVAWTPDGRSIVYQTAGGLGHLFTLPLSGDRKPLPLMTTPARESLGQVSPNGAWLAYQALGAGGRPDVFVRLLAGAGTYQVSTNGGAFPRWRGDGRELFYLEVPGPAEGGKLMTVDVSPGAASFERDAPRALFDSKYIPSLHAPGGFFHAFAVSRDGQRFMIPRPLSAATTDDPTAAQVAVVLNWAAGLK